MTLSHRIGSLYIWVLHCQCKCRSLSFSLSRCVCASKPNVRQSNCVYIESLLTDYIQTQCTCRCFFSFLSQFLSSVAMNCLRLSTNKTYNISTCRQLQHELAYFHCIVLLLIWWFGCFYLCSFICLLFVFFALSLSHCNRINRKSNVHSKAFCSNFQSSCYLYRHVFTLKYEFFHNKTTAVTKHCKWRYVTIKCDITS